MNLLKWDLGKIYAENNYTEEKKEGVMKIVNELLEEYKSMLSEETWLSEKTRNRAISKLSAIDIRIGLPADIESYLSTWKPETDKGYYYNILQIQGEISRKEFDSYGTKPDRTHWDVLPQDMNPCYYPTSNAIYIPVASLEAPYFSADAQEEKNLAELGNVIGHEITHAFDDLGSQYNETGDLENWWTAQDKKAFEERAQKIVTYYNHYRTPGEMQTDGQQTLGENIADLGSMHCMTRIVQKKHLDAKEFFKYFADSWASTADAMTAAMMSGMDEHASDKVRVNAVLSSTDLFYQTYDVKEGDGMYVKPEERVTLW